MGTGLIYLADDPATLDRAVQIIRGGGVVAIPTETFYGLAADATHRMATVRIFEIKGRPATMAILIYTAGEGPAIMQFSTIVMDIMAYRIGDGSRGSNKACQSYSLIHARLQPSRCR